MERKMALQQMADKEHIVVFSVDFVQFLPGTNFVRGSYEDCPVSDKICKITTNHPHFPG